MEFPIKILGVHPHAIFEFLAFFVGFQLYHRVRREEALPESKTVWVFAGAIIGGIGGAFLLYWFENPMETFSRNQSFFYYFDGKTIVGGLLGGLIGVEYAKKRVGITRSTGDDMAIPLIVGIIIGRIGCFLTGLEDHTYGVATTLPWGINFGDGVLRHPTQIYEQIYLFLLGCLLFWQKKRGFGWDGFRFQLFMVGYLSFRLIIEEWKPVIDPYYGLNNIQVASLLGIMYYIQLMIRKGINHNEKRKEGMEHA